MPGARFLVNPGGGRGRAGRHLRELRQLAAGAGVEVVLSRDVEHLRAEARRAAEEGLDRLLVAGGDGTVHHAMRGLVGGDCALAILPLGSGNDLAAALGVPSALSAAVALGLHGERRRIDLARFGEVPFGCVAGVGFDSEVNRYANALRRLRGPLIYVWSVLRVLPRFRPPRVELTHAAGGYSGLAMFVAFANAPRYGGGMRIAPDARLDDGVLDVVVVKALPRIKLLRVFPRVFSGTHTRFPEIEIVRTRRAEIALDRPLIAHGDGEPLLEVGARPVTVEVVPNGLLVVAPPAGI
jgi:diacylglycerol kinase (ATP)